jgi:hypothetical protein
MVQLATEINAPPSIYQKGGLFPVNPGVMKIII